ncbi:MAG: DUF1566 domain-containing protein [Terracidiphilus sp.]
MRNPMIFANCAATFLSLVLCMAGAQACAQNQTPANVPAPPAPVDTVDVWHDPATGLTWTRKDDRGKGIDWNQAKSYCGNLRQDGYADWRLPEIQELAALYDPGSTGHYHGMGMKIAYHIKGQIELSSYSAIWSNTVGKSADQAWYFAFDRNTQFSYKMSHTMGLHALCVRRPGQ